MNFSQTEQNIIEYLKAKTSSSGAGEHTGERIIADAIAAFKETRASRSTNIIMMILTYPAVKPAVAACVIIVVAVALALFLRSERRAEPHIFSRPPDISSPSIPNGVSQPNFIEQQSRIAADEIKMQLDRVAALYNAGDFNTVIATVTRTSLQTQQAIADYLSQVRDENVVGLLTRLSEEVCHGEPNNIFEAAIKNRENLIKKRDKQGAVEGAKTQPGVKNGGVALPEDVIMFTVPIKVVDEESNPIAGAMITPDGLRTKVDPSGHYGWKKELHGELRIVTTDSQGLAEVAYPKYVTEKLLTGAISFRCSHPEFCTIRPTNYPVDGSASPIILQKGAILRVCGYIGNKSNRISYIHAQLSDSLLIVDSNSWLQTGDGWLQSRQIPAGLHYLRIVHFPSSGPFYFSDIVSFEAEKNKVRDFFLELKPGVRVEGRVNNSVPRPVVDGKIVALVGPSEPIKADSSIIWNSWCPIDPDGSFRLEWLPKGQMELAGICDGFVSKSPPLPAAQFRSLVKPQMFALTEPTVKVELLMESAATCEVTVVNEVNELINSANVSFWPNILWGFGGTSIFPGPLFRTEDLIRTGALPKWSRGGYSAKTDARGVAVVRNLPGFKQNFAVSHACYELPAKTVYGTIRRRSADVTLAGGYTTKIRVIMQKKGVDVLGEKEQDNLPPSIESRSSFSCGIEEPNDYVGSIAEEESNPDEFYGHVIDENDNPIEGVLVDAWTWYKGNETYTDANGFFRLDGLKGTKTIEVRFSKDGYSPRLIVRQPLGVRDAVVVLDDRTYFEGSVTDVAGSPVGGARIRAAQGPKRAEGVLITDVWTETISNDDGTYRLYVQPDKYDIQVKAPQGVARYEDVNIVKGQAETFDIVLDAGLTFRAKFLDIETNEPVAGVRLWHWQHKDVNAVSDKAGLIEIPGMLPGKFEFELEGGEYMRWWSANCVSEWNRFKIDSDRGGWQRNFDDLDFDIQPGMDQVTIFVERGVHIRGKVLDPQGNPVGGLTVAPALTGTGNSITGDTRFSVETKQDGTFDMLLPASKDRQYNLVAHDGKYGEWRQWANGVAEPIRTTPGEQIDGVVLRLTVPATVRGKVIDKSGKPVADREVRASASDKNGKPILQPHHTYRPQRSFRAEIHLPRRALYSGRPVLVGC